MNATPDKPEGALGQQWSRDRVVLLSDVVAALLRRSLLVFALPLAMGLAAFLYFQFLGSYVAESTLTPEESGGSLSQLAGLAARFGASVPGLSGQSQSIDFYAKVLSSPALLERVVTTRYRFATRLGGSDSIAGTLVELYGINEDEPSERVRLAIKRLQNRTGISTDRLASIVSISVKAPYRELAQAINRRMLDVLNEFNVQQRQTTARAQRQFTEERVRQAREELTAVEHEMQQFLETNRSYQTSPRLVFESERLQRQIEMRQQVYSTLVQAFEQSRIEEVRDTPAFTVIQRPELYTRRARNPLLMGIATLALFLTLSIALALALEYMDAERRQHPESFARLRELMPATGLRFWKGSRSS